MVVCKQFLAFLNDHNIFSFSQHGYVKNRSTQTAIYQFITKILEELENSYVVGLFLDLSSAFNSLCHEHVCDKMVRYEITDLSIKWFKSYLGSRTQKVSISRNGLQTESGGLGIGFEVPQGSILGHFIFILFINDLDSIFSNTTQDPKVDFADDTNLQTRRSLSQARLRNGEGEEYQPR